MAFAKACKILAGQPSPRFLRIAPFSLSTISSRKKSARELRQRGSDYRCCIPALAGFVSPQSIAPDGKQLFAKDGRRAIAFSRSALRERHVHLDPRFVGLVDRGGLGHVPFALGALRRKQMAAGRMLASHFSGRGDLEPLGDGFPGLATRNRLWHKARKITHPGRVTTAFDR